MMMEHQEIDAWLEKGFTLFPDAVPPGLLEKLRALFEQEMSNPEDEEGMGVNTHEGKDYVSALANAQVPEDVRKTLAAHKSGDIHRIYTHHNKETLRKAVESLPDL